MNSISIRTKLLFSFLFLGISLIALVGWIGYTTGKNSLTHASLQSLKSIREIKRSQIERYFENLRQQCLMLASQDATIEAMKLLKKAFYTVKQELKIDKKQLDTYTQALSIYYHENLLKRLNVFYAGNPLTFTDLAPRDDNALILQYLYLVKNKAATLSTDQLRCVAAGSQYSKIYAHYAPLFREYSRRMKVYDVYLFDLETGYSLIETAGEIDFANSTLTGGLKNTNLAQAIEYIRVAKDKNTSKMVDFEFYNPSLGAPNAFIAAPIFDGDKKIGALAFEISIDEINSIMTNDHKWEEVGLGNSGESYLVGSDFKMRSISRLLVEDPAKYFTTLEALGVSTLTLDRIRLYNTSILLQDVTTVQAEAALQGQSGVIIAQDYRGVPVLTAYAPLTIPDVHWGIVAKIDKSEALAPVTHLATRALWVAVLALIALSILTIPFTRWILTPIRQLNAKVQRALRHKIGDQRIEFEQHSLGDVGILSRSIAKLHDRQSALLADIDKYIKSIEHNYREIQQEVHRLFKMQESMPALSAIKDKMLLFDQAVDQSVREKERIITALEFIKENITAIKKNMHMSISSLADFHEHDENILILKKYSDQTLYTLELLTEHIHYMQSLAAGFDHAQRNTLTYKQELNAQVQVLYEKTQALIEQIRVLDNFVYTGKTLIIHVKDLLE